MSFLPRDFTVPERVEGPGFHLRSITVHDLARDYDAVMSSRDHLWARFGALWGWPPADLSITQDLVDLGWHQKEFQLRRSFNYAVMAPDESRLLGCVYIDPPDEAGIDAEVWFWGRQDRLADGLELAEVYATIRSDLLEEAAVDYRAGMAPGDAVLLRRAIAARALGRADASALARQLTERFDAASERGDDGSHLRERARFALALAGDLREARRLARRNLERQREPADWLILARADAALGDQDSLRLTRAKMTDSGVRDARIEALR